MLDTGFISKGRSSGAWLEGLSERQKILARLCALKAEDAQLLEALWRIMDCYGPLETPGVSSQLRGYFRLPRSGVLFTNIGQASNSRRTGVTFGRFDEGGAIGASNIWPPRMRRASLLYRKL